MKKVLLLLLASLGFVGSVSAELGTELLIKQLERPVWVGAPRSSKDKLWVMEQPGKIWVVDTKSGERSKKPFLDISERVTRKGNEQGLLGLAFASDFASSGCYYVNFTEKHGHTLIVRFISKDGMTTADTKGETILKIHQPFENHNGGWLDFGPDGFLYIATGDGGAANDPKNLAQKLSSHLGKLLRLDVSGSKGYKVPSDNAFAGIKGALPEIHAIGLRNPWRCSFDRVSGDFWIGDVGQNHWEEINYVEKGKVGGLNFGWRLREGDNKTPAESIGGEKPMANHEPIYTYKHGSGEREGLSVTGGFVYRGSQIAELKGRYLFADYQNPRIWSFLPQTGKASDFKDHTSELQPKGGRINLISSFGEDAEGELYLCDLSGAVYRIVGK
jgi:glucose/arabinose dehydrogenase